MTNTKRLTLKEFAKAVRVSPPIVLDWIRRQILPAEKTAFGVWQIAESEIDRFLQPEYRPKIGRPIERREGEP